MKYIIPKKDKIHDGLQKAYRDPGEYKPVYTKGEQVATSRLVIYPFLVLSAIIICILYVWMCSPEPKKSIPWTDQINTSEAYAYTVMQVKNKLKCPSTADFPWLYDDIKYLGKQSYAVLGHVDSQNSFGAMVRTYYLGQVKQVSKGTWQLISLTFGQK